MNATNTTARIHALVDRLPPGALAGLLAAVARLCPMCGSPATIRTSRQLRGEERVAYLVCDCGHSWKSSVVGVQHSPMENPKPLVG